MMFNRGRQQQQQRECSDNPGHPCEGITSERTGEFVCQHCGCVMERLFDAHLEKRLFGEVGDDDKKRADVEDPNESELSATVSSSIYRPTGVMDLAPGTVAMAGAGAPSRKLARELTAKNKAIEEAQEKLIQYCEGMRLSGSIREMCRNLYHEFCEQREIKKQGTRGCRTDAVLAAVVYLGCKRDGNPRTFREVSKDTGVSQQDIRSGFKLLMKTLPQNVNPQNERTNPKELVARICEKLNLPFQITSKAQIITEAASSFVEGKQPSSIAAAVISLVCRKSEEQNQRADRQIAEFANVTPTTIRVVATEIEKYWGEINKILNGSQTIQATQPVVNQPPSVIPIPKQNQY